MASYVCVDASFALMLLLPHNETPQVEALWQFWAEEGIEPVSAPLFLAEVTSVLRESVYFKRISAERGEAAFALFIHLPVRSLSLIDLQPQAWALAQKKYNRPRAYDAQYLAVALSLGCDLRASDRRLINAVHAPWLKGVHHP
jgi:predicted nucleic acid-binding protein